MIEDLAGNDVESFRGFLAIHIDNGTSPSLRTAGREESLRWLVESNPVLEVIENQMPL